MQTTLARSAASSSAVVRPAVKQTRTAGVARRVGSCSGRASIAPCRSSLDTNFFVNAIESAVAVSIPVAISIVTAEKSDDEFLRVKTPEGLLPIGAAVVADAVAHSIPGEFFVFVFSALIGIDAVD